LIIINFSVEGPRASRVRPKLWWMAATSTPQHLPGGTKTMAVAAVADVVEQKFSNLLLLSPLKEWKLGESPGSQHRNASWASQNAEMLV
jgi:hypothetical protein